MIAWLLIAGGALVVVVLAVSLVQSVLVTSTTVLVRIVRVSAAAYAAIVVIAALPVVVALAADGPVAVDVPIQPMPVEVPRGVDFGASGPIARVEATGSGTLALTLTGLSIQTRLLLGGGHVVMAVALVVVALAAWQLAGALRSGRPFVRPVSRALTAAAAAVGIGGTVWSLLLQLGSWNAAEDALRVTGYGITGRDADSLPELGWPEPAPFDLTIEFWPLLVAFGLAAVAAVLRAGVDLSARATRLERDTAGLV